MSTAPTVSATTASSPSPPISENAAGSYDGNLTIIGNSANNDIAVTDSGGVESLVGGGGNDTLNASSGVRNSATTFLQGNAGNDLLVGDSNGINHYFRRRRLRHRRLHQSHRQPPDLSRRLPTQRRSN